MQNDNYNDALLWQNLGYLVARFSDNDLTETELIKILYTIVKNKEYNISEIAKAIVLSNK